MVRSGRGFDGGQGPDFADFLRRELHAAADQVEPGADGLERIRDKIRSRPAHASRHKGALGLWLAFSGVVTALVRRLGDLVRRAVPARGGDRSDRSRGGAPGRDGARQGGAGRAPQRPRDWREAMLRPAFAVGVAVFAIGVVLSAVPPARQAMVTMGDAIGSALNINTPPSKGAGADRRQWQYSGAHAGCRRYRAQQPAWCGRAYHSDFLPAVVHAFVRDADQDQPAERGDPDDHRARHVVQREPEQREHHESQLQSLRQPEHQPERESQPSPDPSGTQTTTSTPPASPTHSTSTHSAGPGKTGVEATSNSTCTPSASTHVAASTAASSASSAASSSASSSVSSSTSAPGTSSPSAKSSSSAKPKKSGSVSVSARATTSTSTSAASNPSSSSGGTNGVTPDVNSPSATSGQSG